MYFHVVYGGGRRRYGGAGRNSPNYGSSLGGFVVERYGPISSKIWQISSCTSMCLFLYPYFEKYINYLLTFFINFFSIEEYEIQKTFQIIK